MDFNSFTILSKKAAQLTSPHLRAAERGERAPVEPIDNTLASTIANQVRGTAHTVKAPVKALWDFSESDLRLVLIVSKSVSVLYRLTRCFAYTISCSCTTS